LELDERLGPIGARFLPEKPALEVRDCPIPLVGRPNFRTTLLGGLEVAPISGA